MVLEYLGWNQVFNYYYSEFKTEGTIPARVSEECKEVYHIFTERGEMLAHMAGKLRFRANHLADLPVVGDWVVARSDAMLHQAVIEKILPRQTAVSRKVAGRKTEEQVLAANVNTVFVVTSLNQELNLRRLERYLAVVWESGATPVIVLSKADLCGADEALRLAAEVENMAGGVGVCVVSAVTTEGMDAIKSFLKHGETVALIGSSGVGKSTIINRLCNSERQHVNSIRKFDDRGRHTTTSRQMILLPEGGLVIDSPGMRELQLWNSEQGFFQTFDDIERFSAQCRFRDCKHETEPECAVLQAIEDAKLAPERLSNYKKLQSELKYLRSKNDANQQREAKKQAKRSCKAHKRFYKQK